MIFQPFSYTIHSSLNRHGPAQARRVTGKRRGCGSPRERTHGKDGFRSLGLAPGCGEKMTKTDRRVMKTRMTPHRRRCWRSAPCAAAGPSPALENRFPWSGRRTRRTPAGASGPWTSIPLPGPSYGDAAVPTAAGDLPRQRRLLRAVTESRFYRRVLQPEHGPRVLRPSGQRRRDVIIEIGAEECPLGEGRVPPLPGRTKPQREPWGLHR